MCTLLEFSAVETVKKMDISMTEEEKEAVEEVSYDY